MRELSFPEGFLWGTATASHQVEGATVNSDWWRWEQAPGRIHNDARSGAACDWWNGRAEEDLALAAALGQNAHRLSLEWSRLEPADGYFDTTAFARYRRLFETMHDHGLVPMVTLHHFTLPRWAADMGGWTNRALVGRFRRFGEECARRLGDLVPLWCTVNEPSVLVYMAYAGTAWPPGRGNIVQGFQAARHLLQAHAAVYHTVRAVQPGTSVGIVLNMPVFDPARDDNVLDYAVARLQDWVMIEVFVRSVVDGELYPPLVLTPKPAPTLRDSFDFVGVNYYGRYMVRFDPTAVETLFGRHVQRPTVHTDSNDWGQIYPDGLTRQLLRLRRLGVPLYVTENGIFDNEDTLRPQYLLDHLAAVQRAIQAGADVRGYFHWSLVDNFEWAEGWSTHFGLIGVDPRTQQRRIKRSALRYAEMCRNNAIRLQE